jgi:hypothetical protein
MERPVRYLAPRIATLGGVPARFFDLCAISPLSTGNDSHFSLSRLGKAWQVQVVIGTEVPASPEGRKRQEGTAGDGRTDLHRMAMRRASAQVGPPEEAPEELAMPLAVCGFPLGSKRRGGADPRRAAEGL